MLAGRAWIWLSSYNQRLHLHRLEQTSKLCILTIRVTAAEVWLEMRTWRCVLKTLLDREAQKRASSTSVKAQSIHWVNKKRSSTSTVGPHQTRSPGGASRWAPKS